MKTKFAFVVVLLFAGSLANAKALICPANNGSNPHNGDTAHSLTLNYHWAGGSTSFKMKGTSVIVTASNGDNCTISAKVLAEAGISAQTMIRVIAKLPVSIGCEGSTETDYPDRPHMDTDGIVFWAHQDYDTDVANDLAKKYPRIFEYQSSCW